jgi:helicase MOV-10
MFRHCETFSHERSITLSRYITYYGFLWLLATITDMVLQICPSLLSTGACFIDACPANHLFKLCEPCGQVCLSLRAYDVHVRGAKHAKKLKESSVNLRCITCDRHILAYQWSDHISAASHISKSNRLGVSPVVQPVEGQAPPGLIHCAICNVNINVNAWATHAGGVKHKKKEDYYALKAVLDEAESDKHGVAILPKEELDLGVIELPVAREGIQSLIVVEVSDADAQIQIAQTKLITNLKRDDSSFVFISSQIPWSSGLILSRFSLFVDNAMVAHGVKSHITIKFRQKNRGRYGSRAQILFEDLVSKEKFMIVRPVLAIVGSKNDHETLKPVTPYQPSRRHFRDIKNIVLGVVRFTRLAYYIDNQTISGPANSESDPMGC